jgi:hypothetical protein
MATSDLIQNNLAALVNPSDKQRRAPLISTLWLDNGHGLGLNF